MDERERRGREYVEDLIGESVPRATWPGELKAALEEFLAAAPGLLPPTHPKGPRSLDHMPWQGRRADVFLFEDPDLVGEPPTVTVAVDPAQADQQPPLVAIRYAPEVVEEMRRRFGRHWPAEPPMLETLEKERRREFRSGRRPVDMVMEEVGDPEPVTALELFGLYLQNMVPVPTSVLQQFLAQQQRWRR